MLSKKVKYVLRIAVSFLFLAYLAWTVDFSLLRDAFRQIELQFFVLSTCFAFSGVLFMTLKYFILIRNSPLEQPFISLLKIQFISRFYALLIPSGFTQDIIRWYRITRNEKGRSFFLASTIFERFTFVFLLLLTASVPLFVYSSHDEIVSLRDNILPLMLLLFLFSLLAFAYFSSSGLQSLLRSALVKLLPSHDRFQNMHLFLNNFALKNTSVSFLSYIFVLSILWQILYLIRMFYLFEALALPLAFKDIIWMSSLVLLLQAIPVSLAGLGIRESAYAYLFTLFGLPREQGLLIGILFFVQMVLISAVGGIIELSWEKGK